ncbi:MAG TPA: TolC family protein [Candidatus Udaeobacter sp.]|jgi:outer membrane protein TolC|nr:TolC family protein [Candidatus Udaeobacter sp.]
MTRFLLCLGIIASLGVAGKSGFAGSEGRYETTTRTRTTSGAVPTFTLDQAILTAVQRNPTLLNAEQEIKRTRGVIIQVRAQALPQINANANFQWTDPNLTGARILGTNTSTSGFTPSAAAASLMEGLPLSQVGDPRTPVVAPTPSPVRNIETSDVSYAISVTGTQLIFNGTTFNQIRGTFFQRDSAYFAFRNVLDQLIATVKTQFYQIIVNRELVKVNEENVRLLEAQLKDQQNRFEAGTVPRFNVLQADVQLHNQIPQLIATQNNLRISKLQLAKTLGLDFRARRGDLSPLEVIGDMPYIPRPIELVDAIELGKQRRAFLKQARANVLNQLQQVRAAAGQYLPTITTTGGGEWVSSPVNSSWHDISKGWTALVQGSVPIWDSGAIAGQVIQQRALLSEAKITYDDDVRQVELEIQQAYSNLQQNRELIQSQEKNVELADEALRLAKARLDAGAGVQLDVLNATVQLLTAQSTRLEALFGYNSSLAEFDRATGAQSTYTEMFASLRPRATATKTYYTGSDVDAMGHPKETGEERVTTTTRRTSSK